MARRPKKDSGGVPEWVVTFGDMMTLLLCFFVLLAAFSELKKEHEYQKVVTAVKEAFGYSGGVGVLPIDDPPLRSMIESLQELAKRQMSKKVVSQNTTPGMQGKESTVTRVQDGLKFTIGGSQMFEPASATLNESAKPELERIARLLIGKRFKIEIRGHAASKTLPPGSPYRDLLDLSYYRAKAVHDFLVQQGLDPLVLRISAAGDTEPVEPRAYTPETQAVNRRVEIIQTEAEVEETNPDPNFENANYAKGG
ncbi:MAG: flagellar motor protein MotB [Phycisphaeraceae bacterium]|nr:flagellar motor protein MotB [Phycisphaeraceae bacterium]